MADESGFAQGEQQSTGSSWYSGILTGGLGKSISGLVGTGGFPFPWGMGGSKETGGAPWLDPSQPVASPYADAGPTPAKEEGGGKEVSVKPERDSRAAIKDAVTSDGKQQPGADTAGKTQPGIQSPTDLDKALGNPNSADAKRAEALGMSPQQYKQEYRTPRVSRRRVATRGRMSSRAAAA